MKNRIGILFLFILATCAVAAAARPHLVPDNPFIQKMKTTFAQFFAARPGERIYIHTDKTLYQAGETLWFAAYLRADSNLSAATPSGTMRIELINPKGNVEQEMNLIVRNGVAKGDFAFDNAAAGGIYKIKAQTNWQLNDENPYTFTKEITLQKVVLPRVLQKIDFDKKSYQAYDIVQVKYNLKDLKNQPIGNKKLTINLNVDGALENKMTATTDAKGDATIGFALSGKLNTTDVLINLFFDNNGTTESIARTVPVVLNKINVQFFAEGGDLIDNISSKMAFAATNEFGKPAEIKGKIMDSKGKMVANFESFHNGMGAFDITPKPNETYTAIVEGTSKQEFKLPTALPKGYALQVNNAAQKNTINLKISSTQKETLQIITQIRGKIYDAKTINITANKPADLSLNTQKMPMGVAQITLFDEKGTERAERLVFVNHHKKLNLKVSTNKDQYTPREKVNIEIIATDENGLPIEAQLSLSVADAKNLSFADDKQGNIISKLLLEPDVKGDILEPNFYFDGAEPKAQQALDYVMMTQGWRRFTWKQIIDNQAFTPNYNAQRAVVDGYVYNQNGQPETNAKIVIDSTKKQYTTNEKGFFVIPDLDIYEPTTITITNAKGLKTQETVYDYSTMSIYLYENRPVPMMWQRGMVEAAAGGGVVQDAGVFDAPMNAGENVKFEMQATPPDFANAAPPIEINAAGNAVPFMLPEGDFKLDAMNMGAMIIQEKDINIAADDINPGFDGLEKRKMGFVPPVMQQPTLYYRAKEFAAPIYDNQNAPTERNDFRTTVFWAGNITTNRRGRAEISFYNSDAISNFKIITEGISADGNVAHHEATYNVFKPVGIDCKLPIAATLGDVIQVPVLLQNNTNNTISGFLKPAFPQGFVGQNIINTNIEIAPNATKTVNLEYVIKQIFGDNNNNDDNNLVKIAFETTDGNKDIFVQKIDVGAKGFPVNQAFSNNEKTADFNINVQDVVAGSIEAKFVAYPTAVSDLIAGVESILREPSGCFEQTSSSTYPNIMVLDLLKQSPTPQPAIEARATALIQDGYGKLTAFETPEKGYEWFGGTPAHEALSAYGLMEFVDMANILPAQVNMEMVERTANWIISRKDGAGGFQKSAQALDDFGRADTDITNAYIVWSLTEAGYHNEIMKEIEKSYTDAQKSTDGYLIGLVANALFNINDKRANEILKKLLTMQQPNGSILGKKHSITYTQGNGLQIETTALAAMAVIKSPQKNVPALEKAIKFIVQQRQAFGGFGNTQTTIMALKALTNYAKFAKRTQESGDILVMIDGKQVGKAHFEADQQGSIEIKNLEKYISTKHKITVQFINCKDALPYTLSVNYHTNLPPSSDKCKVNISTKLNSNTAKMGETLRLTTTLTNKTDNGLPMTMAVVGIPAGLSVQGWQLKELLEKKQFDFFETTDQAIIFYYRQMKPNEIRTINLDLKTEFVGNYKAQASSAYLYYTTEHIHWAGGTAIEVK